MKGPRPPAGRGARRDSERRRPASTVESSPVQRLDGLPKQTHDGELAFALPKSGNKKIGFAATTYASQASCPDDCMFRNAGCYAEGGWVARHATSKLEPDGYAIDVAIAEAAAIDRMDVVPGMPMRLHTVGDCRSDTAARIVSAACYRYVERGGGPVWTYTHAWRTVARRSWGQVSVFASCETPLDVAAAAARGYATSIVVEEFPSDRAYDVDGVNVIPCPAQTRDRACSNCRLCFDDQARRRSGKTIGFALHGDGMTMRRARARLRGEPLPVPTRQWIEQYLAEHRRWPTKQEIVDACRVNESSAWQMMERMRAENPRILTVV